MISCEQHDYLEIACMHNLLVKLTLKNGDVIEGSAVDTSYTSAKQECLTLLVNNEVQYILLTNMLSMQALENTSYFDVINFAESS